MKNEFGIDCEIKETFGFAGNEDQELVPTAINIRNCEGFNLKLSIFYLRNEFFWIGADDNQIYFGEDQSRYVVVIDSALVADFMKRAEKNKITIFKIGEVIADKIHLENSEVKVQELIKLNEAVFERSFS